MSYTYLQGPGEESSAACFADIPQCVLLKSNNTAGQCCFNGSGKGPCPGFQSGTMCEPSTASHGMAGLTWWQGDFLAKTFPRLARVQELMAADPGFGERWQGLSVKLAPDMSGWKTARCLWEEDLPESLVTLPGWGLMQGGEFWGQTMPGPHTSESEFGSLVTYPTPKASEDRCGTSSNGQPSLGKMALDDLWPTPTVNGNYNRKGASKTSGDGLATAVAKWPTPTVQDSNKATRRWRDDHQNNLTAMVFNPAKWPTPTASQYRGWSPGHNRAQTDDRLDYTVERESLKSNGKKLKLNPDWVEWLMGWPIGWTSLEPLQAKPFPLVDSWQADPADSGEVPRAGHKIPQRVNRYKAIGNGQVPQVVALAWWVLSGGIK